MPHEVEDLRCPAPAAAAAAAYLSLLLLLLRPLQVDCVNLVTNTRSVFTRPRGGRLGEAEEVWLAESVNP